MSEYGDRIADLAERARRDRETFEPPETPPDEEAALTYARDGVGPVVAIYVDARAGADAPVAFDPAEFELLERAMNDWLELYAACYGVEIDAAFTVREAAELLIDTHDINDTAMLLTGVQPRNRDTDEENG